LIVFGKTILNCVYSSVKILHYKYVFIAYVHISDEIFNFNKLIFLQRSWKKWRVVKNTIVRRYQILLKVHLWNEHCKSLIRNFTWKSISVRLVIMEKSYQQRSDWGQNVGNIFGRKCKFHIFWINTAVLYKAIVN